ncbi:MAG: hypothetical protein WC976_06665 [Caldisericia bacterium]
MLKKSKKKKVKAVKLAKANIRIKTITVPATSVPVQLPVPSVATIGALPTLVDTLLSIEGNRVGAQNRITHIAKHAKEDPETEEVFRRLVQIEDYLTKRIGDYVKVHPAYPWYSRVKGIGLENIAKVVGLVDINKCPHVSSLWQFAGYGKDKETGETQRREKGKKLSYCSQLRMTCWRLGSSLLRANGKFKEYYDKEKEILVQRFTNEGKKIVPSAELPKVNGKHVENDKVIAEGHIHAMAFRKMIKLFLQFLWLEWRKGVNLPVSEPYAIGKLGHQHLLKPEEFCDKVTESIDREPKEN